MRTWLFRWLVVLGCCWFCFACAKDEAERRGELMLTITTDLEPPKDFDEIHVEVLSFGSVQFSNDYAVGERDLRLPSTLGLVVGSEPTEPVTIRVMSSLRGRPRSLREVVTTIPRDRVATLTVKIEWLCLDQVEEQPDGTVTSTCDDGETCVGGSCVPWEVDSTTLPDYAVEDIFGGGDGSGSGRCFDTVGCFAGGYSVEVNPRSCSFPAVTASGQNQGVSVALVLGPGSDGICGPEACLVPLDAGAVGGWVEAGDEIQLPPAICARLEAGDIWGVAVTTACESKTESLPTCGLWSSVDEQEGTFVGGAPEGVEQPGQAASGGEAGVAGASGTAGTSPITSGAGGVAGVGNVPAAGDGGAAGLGGSAGVATGATGGVTGGTGGVGGGTGGEATGATGGVGGIGGSGGVAAGAAGGEGGFAGLGGEATGATGGTGGSSGLGGSGGVSGGGGSGETAGESGCVSCTFLGDDTVRIGASMEDDTALAAPFDARYVYLAGPLPDLGACESCSEACAAWWGCWQDYGEPPGQYLTSFLDRTESAVWQSSPRPQVPHISYYTELQASGLEQGEPQLAALNDAAFLTRYLVDWRFVLERIGDRRAMLHIEPDLWHFVRLVNPDPHQVPAQVTTANPTDCADQEDSVAGLARCMIHMVRDYAPGAAVGLHASPWLLDTPGDGLDTGAFMAALGAGEGDFVVSEISDRDAGYYESLGTDTWWHSDADAQKHLDWVRDVAESLCLPAIVWQVPVGNMALNNTTDHWQDTRVDWLFAHMPAVGEAHIAALLFGAGVVGQTTPETDGGNLIARTTAYWASGGAQICP